MSAARKSTRTRPLALAYVRVSTAEQANGGASLDAQRAALTAEAERRGWDVEVVTDAGFSAKNLRRPGLVAALARLDDGDADALLAVRIDRVSRSVGDFTRLVERAHKHSWRLVMLSPDIDTESAAGMLTAHVLAAVAQFERDLMSTRTREGMAQRRAEGVHVGRPAMLPVDVVARVVRHRSEGATLRTVAEQLNADGIPTAHGGAAWHASTVRAVLSSTTARAMA